MRPVYVYINCFEICKEHPDHIKFQIYGKSNGFFIRLVTFNTATTYSKIINLVNQ